MWGNVVVIGRYIILENKILVQIEAIDVFTKEVVAITNIEGNLGVDQFRIIDNSSNDMTNKMIKEFPVLEKSNYDQ